MPRFFINASDVVKEDCGGEIRKKIIIRGNDALHISRVLRMKQGERLVVCDSDGVEYSTEIEAVGDECVLDVVGERASLNEPPYRAVIYQALVKGDKFETVIQKGTEMGASVFVPVVTKRCVVRLDEKDAKKKQERWQRIAEEAAKQCGRAVIPEVRMPVTLAEALQNASEADGKVLFCYEGEGTLSLPELLSVGEAPQTVSVFIGPEGGFDGDEVILAKEKGVRLCGLGRRILRTETASLFVLSCLSYCCELSG